MYTKTHRKQNRSVKKKNNRSFINRRSFLKLPLSERRKFLKDQSRKLAAYYENESEWKEFEAFDINNDF